MRMGLLKKNCTNNIKSICHLKYHLFLNEFIIVLAKKFISLYESTNTAIIIALIISIWFLMTGL